MILWYFIWIYSSLINVESPLLSQQFKILIIELHAFESKIVLTLVLQKSKNTFNNTLHEDGREKSQILLYK